MLPGQPINAENRLRIDSPTAEAMWQRALVGVDQIGSGMFRTKDGIVAAVDMAKVIAAQLPDHVRGAVEVFGTERSEQGMLLLQGLRVPHELTGVVPESRQLPDIRVAQAAGLMAVAMTTIVGNPVSYRNGSLGYINSFMTQVSPIEPH
ncbi:MAG: hypothetical protein AAB834_04855, partial [Patescibacteria group bacterium]